MVFLFILLLKIFIYIIKVNQKIKLIPLGKTNLPSSRKYSRTSSGRGNIFVAIVTFSNSGYQAGKEHDKTSLINILTSKTNKKHIPILN